ncbi:hypothetical protein [Chelatococcus reniformis]|uniref:Uncharacterized protein n=1 Tax=Chelatococcus reniformis TaxID=1494448 RepID=A0A916UXB7_9HYPH|nr:hypothetical protein [Chelatococcus reniformis]GGC92455.1 hypothetical protein GCM10010994_57850 [Chelatococcus reniformis]
MSDDLRAASKGGDAESPGMGASERGSGEITTGAGGDVAETLKALRALDAQAQRDAAPRVPEPVVGQGDRPVPPVGERGKAAPAPATPDTRPQASASEAGRQASAGDGGRPNSLVVWQPSAAEAPPPAAEPVRSLARPFAFAAGLAAMALLGGIGVNALRNGAAPPGVSAGAAVADGDAGPQPAVAATDTDTDARARIEQLAADVAALKTQVAALDGSARAAASSGDLAAVRDKVAALDAGLAAVRQDAGPAKGGDVAAEAERMTQLAERLSKVEKQLAVPPPKPAAAVNPSVPAKDVVASTGAIGNAQAAAAKPAPPKPQARPLELAKATAEPHAMPERPAAESRGAADLRPPAEIPDPRKRQARGWVLRDLYDGVALIQGRDGVIEVAPGQRVAGLGRVERIERRGSGWVVVTERGYIPSLGY